MEAAMSKPILSTLFALFSFSALADVIVFGGTRETGLETVKALVAKGEAVTVMVRPVSNTEALKALGPKVTLVVGDALNADEVKKAFASGKFRAAVSSLGGARGEKRPDWEGNRNVTEAAKAAGIKRLVQVSAIGVGDSVVAVSEETIKFLGPVYAEKIKAEDHLKASGLEYTIIRPGGLTDGPPTGNGM
ncbi:MAG: SDR family oxidoreductase, partial [Alphaproteobacteria bacterium]|nr:SDR family oxidoreductase [Alphaproteobacteria bacterium]